MKPVKLCFFRFHARLDGVIVVFFLKSLIVFHQRKLTWYRGTHSNQCDSSNFIIKTDNATEVTSNVTNDGGQQTDTNDGDSEASPTSQVVSWWDESEQKL